MEFKLVEVVFVCGGGRGEGVHLIGPNGSHQIGT